MTVQIIGGDSRDVLKTLPNNSIDSCCTDPPYALVSITKRFGKPGSAPAKGNDAYMRASAGFMGQSWDVGETAFDPAFWVEVLRVLKPGGHCVAFGGTRSFHRLACAIEDAGFEIRDMALWLYGSGFPKSHNVSKGIAKRRVEDEEPVRVVCRFVRRAMDVRGLKSRDLIEHFGGCNARLIDHWAARDTDSQPSLPTNEQWISLKAVLGLPSDLDAEVERLNARKGSHGEAWSSAEVIGEHDGQPGGFGDHRFSVRDPLIRRLDEQASAWEGWGTALKPAVEPVCIARKPLSEKTVAANVLKWGTGALNIDGCRIEAPEGAVVRMAHHETGATRGYDGGLKGGTRIQPQTLGRWPANVLHDGSDEVLAAFPESAGQQGLVTGNEPSSPFANVYGDMPNRAGSAVPRGDTGSAARFFYSAKADADDRFGSQHPTVKPVDLMRWLCRLVTPPGGTVLDCFAGSGTTGAAAIAEGFDAILIEREAAYIEDIKLRLAHMEGLGAHSQSVKNRNKKRPKLEGLLAGLDPPE